MENNNVDALNAEEIIKECADVLQWHFDHSYAGENLQSDFFNLTANALTHCQEYASLDKYMNKSQPVDALKKAISFCDIKIKECNWSPIGQREKAFQEMKVFLLSLQSQNNIVESKEDKEITDEDLHAASKRMQEKFPSKTYKFKPVEEEEKAVDFADALLVDYEIVALKKNEDVEPMLYWQLAGTKQTYTSEELFKEWNKFFHPAKVSPVASEEQLYKWVKAVDDKPIHLIELPLKVDGMLKVGTYHYNKPHFEINDCLYFETQFHRIEWLKPLTKNL